MAEIATIHHFLLETPIRLSEGEVWLLIAENPHEFFRFVSALDAELNGGEGDFIFLRDGKPISPSAEGSIVCDPFHFDLNDKKIVNLLIKRLAERCRYGEAQSELSKLNGDVGAFFADLFSEMPFSLEYDELTIESLLKAANIRFEKTYDTLLEKIICYINAMVQLKGCKFFIFVGLKGVLDDGDLQTLYHHCALEKIGLFLLENAKVRPILPEEKAILITEDLCEILANFDEM